VWNNQVPFEMRAVRAMPDGFEIEFTKPVDKKSAEDIASYSVSSFTYKYQAVYGSPPVNTADCKIKGVQVSEDGMKARIVVDNLRRYYIHGITLSGVRERENSYALVHPTAYYTLNNIPEGKKLSLSEVSTKSSATAPKAKPAKTAAAKKSTPAKTTAAAKTAAKPVAAKAAAPTYAEVKGLLAKYTCVACHNPEKKQVGPAYADVAKRGYTPERIVKLIHSPEPANWPDYATEMPPMPQVSKEDALKIAKWINSLAPGGRASSK
jgi:cytochrome c551/c552